MLEIATKEYPYSECTNQAQIFRKVTNRVKPAALGQVTDEDIRAFIDVCIEHDPKKRPSATELLNHPFFYSNTQSNGGGSCVDLASLDLVGSSSSSFPGISAPSNVVESVSQHISNTNVLQPLARTPSTHEVESDQHLFYISRHSTPLKPSVTCDVEAVGPVNEDEVTLKMVYHTGTSSCEIKFPFNLTDDTATDVVSELVKENLILAIDEQLTRRRIEEAVRGVLIKQRQGQKSNSEASIVSKYEDGVPSDAKNIPQSLSSAAARIVESPQIESSLSSKTIIQHEKLENKVERISSAPPSTSISTIPIHQPISYSSSVGESLLKSLDLQSLSNSNKQDVPITDPISALKPAANTSVLDRQKEISQKLTELQEANLKNFDVSAAAISRPKSSSNSTINIKSNLSLN